MIQVETLSTDELLLEGAKLFKALERCMKAGRRRDRASDMTTDLFLIVESLAKRLGTLEWNERVQSVDDEEDEQEHEPRVEVSLSEVLSLTAHAERYDGPEYEDLGEANKRIRELEAELAGKPLEIMCGIIRYTTIGCKSAEAVIKKWLALVRRVDPGTLRDIGMGQTDVARALGERRATTSKREQREFEAPMKAIGARGWHGTGGLRTQDNRDNCAKAQKGNRNRARSTQDRQADPDEAA